jgi:hypothetical protein
MVGRAAPTVIFADRPRPSGLMHVTTSGGIIRNLFAFAGPLQTCSMPWGP